MNDRDLERFQDNYAADAEALPLVAELHATYGESFLCECLRGDDTLHTLSIMWEVKRELEERFLASVCATEDIREEELKLDILFPNLTCVMSYDKLFQYLQEKEWIALFDIVDPKRSSPGWRVIGRTIFAKGFSWDKCPQPIKEHFLAIKKEKADKASNACKLAIASNYTIAVCYE